jgi:hypothetical protein
MEYIFIDYENVKPGAIVGSDKHREVLVFVGENQKNMSVDFVKSVFPKGHHTTLIQISGTGNNAADFHIAYYLGKYSLENPKASFRIISKDKGYDPLVRHLKSLNIDCERVAEAPKSARRDKETPITLDELCAHLEEMSEKLRPKKEAKLKSYIHQTFHADDVLVANLFSGLQSRKVITLAGGKLAYLVASPD